MPPSPKALAILDAAEAHFGELGFQKANVDAIAASAGASKPLVYRYFRSKRQLFLAVVERVIGEWCDVIVADRLAQPEDDWKPFFRPGKVHPPGLRRPDEVRLDAGAES